MDLNPKLQQWIKTEYPMMQNMKDAQELGVYDFNKFANWLCGQIDAEVSPKIAEIKEKIALKNGYKLKFGTHWEYAMQVTDRTKKQIEMYEEVIAEILSNFSG